MTSVASSTSVPSADSNSDDEHDQAIASSSSSSSCSSSCPPSSSLARRQEGHTTWRRAFGNAAVCDRCGQAGHRTKLCLKHFLPDLILFNNTTKKIKRLQDYVAALSKQKNSDLPPIITMHDTSTATSSTSTSDSLTTSAHASALYDRQVNLLRQCDKLQQRFDALSHRLEHQFPSSSSSSPPSSLSSSMSTSAYYDPTIQIIPTPHVPDLVFIRCANAHALYHYLQGDEALHRHIMSLYLISNTTRSLEKLFEIDFTGKILRLQTYPKNLKDELIKKLPLHIQLHPKNFTHVFSVVHAYNRYHWSLESAKEVYYPHYTGRNEKKQTEEEEDTSNSNTVICRAFYKLKELFILEPNLVNFEGARALDIGAAPGGWTSYLASRGCSRVVAVDPGLLQIPLVPSIIHLQKRMEQVSRAEMLEHGPFDLVVCDMNTEPRVSVELILHHHSTYLPGSLLVLTVKEVKQESVKMFIKQCMQQLSIWYDAFQVKYLLANGRERTLIARKRAAARDQPLSWQECETAFTQFQHQPQQQHGQEEEEKTDQTSAAAVAATTSSSASSSSRRKKKSSAVPPYQKLPPSVVDLSAVARRAPAEFDNQLIRDIIYTLLQQQQPSSTETTTTSDLTPSSSSSSFLFPVGLKTYQRRQIHQSCLRHGQDHIRHQSVGASGQRQVLIEYSKERLPSTTILPTTVVEKLEE